MKFCREHLLIYAVTDRAWTGRMTLFEQVEAALRGGATMVQLREKGLAEQDFEGFLEEGIFIFIGVFRIFRNFNIILLKCIRIINDRVFDGRIIVSRNTVIVVAHIAGFH